MRHRALLAAGASATFDPLSLSPALWLDASDAATITSSVGAVSQWDDKSGNARHVAQASAGSKPTTGAATQNGLNVLSFDGGDFLASASAVTVAQPLSIIFVARSTTPTTSGTGRVLCHRGTAGFQTAHSDGSVGYRTAIVYAGGADFIKGPANAYSTSVYGLSSFVVNGASSTAYVNGTAGTTGNPGTGSIDLCRIGVRSDGTLFLTGNIAELLVFPSALSTTDRASVESYLNTKWAVY